MLVCVNILGQSELKPISSEYALLAQLDRVFGYEPKGQGFESLAARQLRTITSVVVLNFLSARDSKGRKENASGKRF